MWLITGPFDSEQSGDEVSEKTKLLKAGSVYGVGRHKDSALSINNKKISRQNGEFIVGEHSEDDVSNDALVPTLSLRNTKTSAMKVLRGDTLLVVNPDATHQLETGDVIKLAGTINAVVTWDPVTCFHAAPDLPTLDLAACASMGLKLVVKHTRDVTHHLIASIPDPLPPSVLYSLLTPARFVKPEWLVELVRRGADKDGGLEHTYNPPLEKAFRPLVDPALANQNPAMAKLSAWSPSEDRRALFDGIRFAFAVLGSGAGSVTKAMGDVVSRGGADRQFINVEKEAEAQAKGAAGIWGTVLRKRKTVLKEGMGSGLVIVGEEETMTGRGIPKDVKKAWEAMVEKARSAQMRIIHPSLITEAIFKAEVSVLDCVIDEDADAKVGEDLPTSTSLPDHVPSTHLEEPSQLPSMEITHSPEANAPAEALQTSAAGPSRRLTRRATSQTPAPESAQLAAPMKIEEGEPAPARKKPLKRRAKTGGLVNELLGLDDTTVLEVSQDASQSQPAPPVQGVAPPTPARPGRLKRRAGTAAPSSQLFPDLQAEVHGGGDEPPLKKFKALFDQSGQGCGTDQTDNEIYETGDGGVPATQLAAVREEAEEEEEEEFHSRPQARKRKADGMEVDEEERDVVVNIQVTKVSSALKKRAIEAMNAVEPSQKPDSLAAKQPSHAATTMKGGKAGAEAMKNKGAAPGKPDTDPTFLRAIASKKRGKKTEDDFDREFNKLRIAKPDINNANVNADTGNTAVKRGWEGLDDFEKDVGIRGNFMQIVEMEVWKDVAQDQPGRYLRRESGLGARMDWDGRQDFKKFRRKMNAPLREHIPLVVKEDRSRGQGESYWESTGNKGRPRGFDDLSQSQDHSFSQPKFTQTQTAVNSRSKAKPKRKAVVPEEVDDENEEVDLKMGGTATRGKAGGRARKGDASQKGKRTQGLFDMGSDEDEDVGAGPSAPTGGVSTLDNEAEDIDLTLRSTREPTQTQSPKRRARGTKRKAVAEDSGSDEGLTFGGFVRAKKRK